MIDCAQYRRALLSDPRASDPELAMHVKDCAECSAYTQRLLRFESRLERAMRFEPRDGKARPRVHRGWLAMAASVLLALVVGGGLWLAAPHSSLAADVVAHMAGEPDAWARTDVPVPSSELSQVLDDAHMRLNAGAGMVSYAQSCLFRGRRVPHLVVQSEMGPITVMVLVHESVSKPVSFDEEGYRGVILPVPGHGSIAVLAQGENADLKSIEKIGARVQSAIVWTG
jgi:Protein of unknown function (DUF3379)